MPLRFEQLYRVKRRDNLGDPEYWNSRFSDIDRRTHTLEEGLSQIDLVGARVEGIALARLDTVVTPMVQEAKERLRSLSNMFTADSVSTVTVGLGEHTFIILENQRQTFATIDYVSIRKVNDVGVGMLGRISSYDRDTGELVVNVEQVTGSGTHDEWRITISSPPDLVHATLVGNPHGTTAAQVGAYTTAQTDTAISTAITALKGGASTSRDTLKELSDAIDALSTSTTSALSGKASTSHNHDSLYYTKAETTSLVGASKVHGTVELVRVSDTQIRLSPSGGGYLNINGVLETVPAGGVTASNTALSSNTRYYVYAYMNGATMTLDLSTTVPVLNATGILVKTGATGRTLVGQVRLEGTLFKDEDGLRYVRSYFNDRGLHLVKRFTADRSRTNTTLGEIHTEGEMRFVAWDGEAVQINISGTAYNNSSGAINALTLSVDGSTSETTGDNATVLFKPYGSSSYDTPIGISRSVRFTEGVHWVNLYGRATTGTLVVRSGLVLSAYAGPVSR